VEKLVFHVDVNSAFLSWEAMRRVKHGDDDLRLIPSAIGGDKDKRTGIILAKSIPAKKYGIKTGEPVAAALRKCPNLVLAKPNFRLYEKCSKAFTDICREYTPVVEKVSIDECFMDMSGTGMIYPDPIKIAYEIKEKIRDTLGFTVNVGVSCNKILAKMASDLEKPDKVHTLFPDEIEEKIWQLPIRELYSVGAATAVRLSGAGIRTIGDLARSDLRFVQKLLGEKSGKLLHDYANGIDDSIVHEVHDEAKGFSISTTLEDDVLDRDTAHRVLLALADSVSARIRADDAKAFCVSVTIRSNDFKNRSHQRKIDEPTDITSEIYRISCELFDHLWDKKTPLRLLGIALTDIVRDEYSQGCLFCDENKEKERKLDKAIDSIRGKFGSDMIVRGATYNSKINVGKKYKAQIENKREEE